MDLRHFFLLLLAGGSVYVLHRASLARAVAREHVPLRWTVHGADRDAQRVGAGAAADGADAARRLRDHGVGAAVRLSDSTWSYAVWDYRGLPHNFRGQICPQYFCGWLGIALLAVFLDDGVRYLAFGEAIGPYCLF